MALVVICGQPCSGKSTAALFLAEALKESESKQTVRIIDESSFHLDRNQSYANMTAEKNLRGVLRSEVDRSVSKDNIIIVDSLNSIKGYRYELWCLARGAGIRYCVLYCDAEETHCRKWNEERGEKGEAAYDAEIFEDLVRRFERPDRRNRWDSPLFELWPHKDGIEKSSAAVLDAVSYLTKKVDSKTQDVKILQPTIATQSGQFSEANSLYELDRATQEVINAIVEAQSQALGGPINGVSLGQGLPTINISRSVGLPELRRLRRTFIKLTGQTSLSGPPPPSDADSAKRMFVQNFDKIQIHFISQIHISRVSLYRKTMMNNNCGSKNEEEVGSYFLEVARGAHKKKEEEMEEDTEDEECPTELNTINSSGGFLVVSTDKISVKYPSVNLHGHDVGVVQANKPAPVKRLVYYFEIYVKDSGAKGQIAIGFTPDNFKMRRQPGWEPHSCGYHGDDGMLYRGQGKGEAFGPTYTANDIVGAGINYASHEFFFTKNGAVVGTVYNDVKGSLFPTIAVHSQNEEVHVNFGQKPFAFDLEDFEKQERMKQQITVEKISLPPNVSHGIVRSYLLHYGYEETLNSFDMASKTTVPPVHIAQENGFDEQDIMYALNERKTLRQLIKNGEIDAALGKLHDWYPQIVQDDKSATCFLLHCQKFIELVRVGALEEAVKYGRIQLAKFFGLAGFEDFVQDCVALLAYEQPRESSVGYLLEDSQREVVADAVNAMILSMNPNLKDSHGCLQSCLERLLRQLTACCLERRSLNGDQGEAFYLHRVLNIGKKC